MDQAHLKRAGTVATVILGNVFYAFVIRLFLLPGNLMTGGDNRYRPGSEAFYRSINFRVCLSV